MFRILLLLFLTLYFAPSIAAFLRTGKAPTVPAGYKVFAWVFILNFFLGWTIIGWFAAWWMAHSEVFAAKMAGMSPVPGGPPDEWIVDHTEPPPGRPPEQRRERPCASCDGTGSQTCTMCSGRATGMSRPLPPAARRSMSTATTAPAAAGFSASRAAAPAAQLTRSDCG
jgi:hypothetical protein